MNLAVFDIESKNWTQAIGLGFFDGKEYQLFEKKNCVKNFIIFLRKYSRRYSSKSRIYIYSHFGGRYDMLFLLHYFLHNHCKIEISIVHSKILKIVWKNIEFRDSYMLLPESLKKLGESFGYIKGEINYENIEKEDWKPYLYKDCHNLWNILNDFKNLMEIKYLPITFPSFAIKKYLSLSQTSYKEIRLSHTKNKFAQEAYFASRCEIFRMRGENIYVYDVNSLFPYAMLNKFPIVKEDKGEFITTDKLDILFKGEGIAYCEIEVFNNKIPCIPIRTDKGKIIFPIGKCKGHYTFPLLRYLLENNYGKVKLIQCLFFKERGYIFQDYVDYFYKMKLKGGAFHTIGKYFLNGLYGKFGEKQKRTKILIRPEKKDIPFILEKGARLISKHLDIWEYTIEGEQVYIPHRNLVYSAYITSYAQIFLHKALIKNQKKVCYCDTDSLHLIGKASEIIIGNDIGEWKLENRADEGFYLLPKTYFLREGEKYNVKAKGFSKDAKPKDIFDRKVKTFAMFPTFKLYVKTGKLRMIKTKKTIKSNYDKREIVGENTKPLKIGV